MKKIAFLSVVFLSILGFTSCTEDKIETFKDTDNIYFSPAVFPYVSINGLATKTDSTGFSFGFVPAATMQKVYKIPVRVQGNLSSVDRKIKVTVDPTSTAVLGTHFTLPDNIMMHAGKEVDTIAVTVLRTPDMKINPVTIVLNLEENESFTTKMKSTVTNVLTQKTMSFIRFKITVDDKFSKPMGWFDPFLGYYTPKKFFLMCQVMNLDPIIFNQRPGSPGIGIADYQYFDSFMKRYLADQKASGNTIYEEDGTVMFFP